MSASVPPYTLILDQHSAIESESFPEFDTESAFRYGPPLVSVPLEGRFLHFVV